jgi:hypothetical protein
MGTLRRDVDRLPELGYPVQAHRGVDGGYQLAAGAVLPTAGARRRGGDCPCRRAERRHIHRRRRHVWVSAHPDHSALPGGMAAEPGGPLAAG